MGKYILSGAIIGGVLSWVMNFSIVAGLILGAILAAISYSVRFKTSQGKGTKQVIQLREEQLDIKKNRVQTGDVTIRKEVVEEQKTFTIPIQREEMVIESGDEEELRIPLKEEEIEITKHPVQVNEVSVTKRQIEEIEQVHETLKKETLSYEKKGIADVKEKDEQS